MDIRIDEPGDGEWVMSRLNSKFTSGSDHVFASYKDGQILGGLVLTWFVGGSITAHCAAQDRRWFSRELAWLVFDYCFNQLRVHKVLLPLSSEDHRLVTLYLRAGFAFETAVRDAFAPGKHMMILGMAKDDCPWLNYKPRYWKSNREAA